MCKNEEVRPVEKNLQGFRQEMKEFIKYCNNIDINFNIVYENAICALKNEENQEFAKNEQESSKYRKGFYATLRNVLKPWKLLLLLAGMLSVTIMYIHFELITIHVVAVGRILLIQALPLYDWRPLQREQCLIKGNSQISSGDNFNQDYGNDCNYCDGINTIPKLKISVKNEDRYSFDDHDQLAEEIKNYYDIDAPILVNTNISTIGAYFSMDNLKSDYQYIEYEPCDIESNVRFNRFPSVGQIFEKLEKAPFYFIQWRNCNLQAMKLFRRHFSRPKYLHVDFSPIQQSWIIISKNYHSEDQLFKKLSFFERLVTIVQVEGYMQLRLTPYHCYVLKKCNDVIIDLNKGDALIVSDQWEVEYSFLTEKHIVSRIETNLAVVLETN